MEKALELYKQELKKYIEYEGQENTGGSRHEAINSHKFYKFILFDCTGKLDSNESLATKTNYLFFAKLVATGALQSKDTYLANKFGTEEAKRWCQVLLNVKEKLNNLDVNNVSEETLKEIMEELVLLVFIKRNT